MIRNYRGRDHGNGGICPGGEGDADRRRRMDARRNGPMDAAAGGPKTAYAAARPPLAPSCQGVRMRGPAAVTAIVNSKCAASDPSWE